MKTLLTYLLPCCLIALLSLNALAQGTDGDLANEYYQNGDYEKAISIFSKLAKDRQNVLNIHKKYLDAMLKLSQYDDADKYLKRQMKNFPNETVFFVDYGNMLYISGKTEQAKQHLEAYIESIRKDDAMIRIAARTFINANLFDYAEKLYIQGRKNGNDKFVYELANVYALAGKTDLMVNEYLEVLKDSPEQVEYIQNVLQSRIREEEDFEKVEPLVFKFIQKYPENIAYNEMLIWYYIQVKNFAKALMQAKAVDKRKQLEGSGIFEIGNLAMENKKYDDAVKSFQYVVERYKDEALALQAERMLVKAKEEQVKTTFPVDLLKIRSLVVDYQRVLDKYGLVEYSAEAARSMALLQAFYLNKKDTAIQILEKLAATPNIRRELIAQAKLDLGDIYLLKGEPWESTLLYSQVEKMQKEKDLGNLAKLKNAKLHYYKGEFEYAKEFLDVLKLATSREIANDAMQLSLLIGDNTALDTSEVALKEFASADLLVFQGQHQQALLKYDQLLKEYPKHSLTDEILWAKANLLVKIGNFNEALTQLQTLLEAYSDDIWGDDANFLMGKIYEENLKDKNKALEVYQNQLVKHAGSTYNVEARRRLRVLRGDSVN